MLQSWMFPKRLYCYPIELIFYNDPKQIILNNKMNCSNLELETGPKSECKRCTCVCTYSIPGREMVTTKVRPSSIFGIFCSFFFCLKFCTKSLVFLWFFCCHIWIFFQTSVYIFIDSSDSTRWSSRQMINHNNYNKKLNKQLRKLKNMKKNTGQKI